MLTRRAPMKRTWLKPRNDRRRAEMHARNFGLRGDAVRAMPCLVPGCRRPTVAAHAKARKMGGCGGDRRELVPLCQPDHQEAGEFRTSARAAFESRHGLDLVAEAARIAAELDQRGLP